MRVVLLDEADLGAQHGNEWQDELNGEEREDDDEERTV
jgi:hypothetical protein